MQLERRHSADEACKFRKSWSRGVGLGQGGSGMHQSSVIETTVGGMGYAFVEAVWASGGLLRVTIDRTDGTFITVDDCERVTRQLQYALEVEGIDYQRLEVSSPGLDRLLRLPEDFIRFAGQAVDVRLIAPFQGRKKYRGVLQAPESGAEGGVPSYVILWDEKLLAEMAPAVPGVKKAKSIKAGGVKAAKAVVENPVSGAAGGGVHELRFSLAEVREVRLVPVLDFRGRKS